MAKMVAKKTRNTKRTSKHNNNIIKSRRLSSFKNKAVSKTYSTTTKRKTARNVNNARRTRRVSTPRRSSRLARHRNAIRTPVTVRSAASKRTVNKRANVSRRVGGARNAVKRATSNVPSRTGKSRVTGKRRNVVRGVIKKSISRASAGCKSARGNARKNVRKNAHKASTKSLELTISSSTSGSSTSEETANELTNSSPPSAASSSEYSQPKQPSGIDISGITYDSVTATTDKREARALLAAINDDDMVPSELETKMCNERWDRLTLEQQSAFYRLARLDQSLRN